MVSISTNRSKEYINLAFSTLQDGIARRTLVPTIYFSMCFAFFSRIFYGFLQSIYAYHFMLIAICVFSCYFVLSRRDILKNIAVVSTFILLPTFISLMWSGNRFFTAYYGSLLAIAVLCGVVTSHVVSARTFDRLLIWTLRFCVLFSFLGHFVGIGATTQIGGDLTRDGFSGIFAHKSSAGYLFGLSASLELLYLSKSRDLLGAAAVAIAGLCLYWSDSRGGQVLFLLNLIVIIIYCAISARYAEGIMRYAVNILIVGLLFVAPLVSYYGQKVEDTLISTTGRSGIWLYTIEAIEENFPSGFGYYSFFGGTDQEPSYLGPGAIGFEGPYYIPPHAHNSILEILVDYGALSVLVIGYLISLLWKLANLNSYTLLRGGDPRYFLYISFFIIPSIVDFWLMAHFGPATYLLFASARVAPLAAASTSLRIPGKMRIRPYKLPARRNSISYGSRKKPRDP